MLDNNCVVYVMLDNNWVVYVMLDNNWVVYVMLDNNWVVYVQTKKFLFSFFDFIIEYCLIDMAIL